METTEQHKSPLQQLMGFLKNSDWGISVSIGGYLVLIFIGMTYSFFYFMAFKINIFHFSELSDFLMAPLANPFVIFFCFLNVAFVLTVVHFGEIWKQKHYASYEKVTQIFTFGTMSKAKIAKHKTTPLKVALLCILYLMIAAMYYGIYRIKKTENGTNLMNYTVSVENNLIKTDSLLFLGDNSVYYFLYDTLQKQAVIIPKDKIEWVKVKKNPKGRIW